MVRIEAEDQSAIMRYEDGNGRELARQAIPYTDLPLSDITLGLGKSLPSRRVAALFAKVVEVSDRNRGKPHLARIPVACQGPAHQVHRGQNRQGVVQDVGLGKQRTV